LLIPSGLGACGLLVAGCAAATGIALGVLTGIFLGRIEASLDATAHSYGYRDTGSALWGVSGSGNPNSNVDLTHFSGRLPGFHLVVININTDKGFMRSLAQEPVFFNTDVEIDFESIPPALTGTIREVDGEQEFDLFDLYPQVGPVSLNVTNIDASGRFDVWVTIEAQTADGDTLEYSLVWHPRLTTGGLSLEGDIDIERVLTTSEGEEFRNEASGTMSTSKQAAD
jgi:hypothetical protein